MRMQTRWIAGEAILDAIDAKSVHYVKVTQPTQPISPNGDPPPAKVEEFTGTRGGADLPTAKDFVA